MGLRFLLFAALSVSLFAQTATDMAGLKGLSPVTVLAKTDDRTVVHDSVDGFEGVGEIQFSS